MSTVKKVTTTCHFSNVILWDLPPGVFQRVVRMPTIAIRANIISNPAFAVCSEMNFQFEYRVHFLLSKPIIDIEDNWPFAVTFDHYNENNDHVWST